MSEFKGTKQNWRLEQSLFYETDKVVLSDHRAICRISIEDEESKHNALLISKAPELLNTLQDISNFITDNGIDRIKELEDYYLNKINRLIKETTEL